jgi:hypothetical protein
VLFAQELAQTFKLSPRVIRHTHREIASRQDGGTVEDRPIDLGQSHLAAPVNQGALETFEGSHLD